MSEEIKKTIIDYVKKEYLEDDSEEEIDENTPLITSGILINFFFRIIL